MNERDVGEVVHKTIDLMSARAVREFSVPPATLIGPGAVARIGEAIAARGMRRVFVVIDAMLEQAGLAEGMFRSLRHHAIDAVVYRQKPGEPESETVEAIAVSLAEAGVDGVVAFGGGSTLDAVKGAVILAANPGWDVRRMADVLARSAGDPARIARRRLPFIAVPTTAGTGSEATNVTVITDSAERVKHLILHPDMIPDLAVIDACLTLRVPPNFTAATGIDALSHAIESYVATRATPLTRALAYRAMTLIGEALPVAVGQGSDVAARESMMLAAYMAGIAFSNAGLGLTHAMAHQIGPAYGIPHGVANAILLPPVMDFNRLVCKRAFAEIGHALSGRIMEPQQTIDYVRHLIAEIGLPTNLSDAGGRISDFSDFSRAALEDPSLTTNPRTASREQIVEVYMRALDGGRKTGDGALVS
ncbi:MAG: iron-containing alcohol dehydrogenase [Candidatus Accumulibacter sp.]|jgi:alcohol dehydrogenase|nr:iron-containing alcohol dehydrogenase [Accumulibacter sp.]